MKTTIIKYMTLAILLFLTMKITGCSDDEAVGSLQYPVHTDEQVSSFFNDISKDFLQKRRDFFGNIPEEEDVAIIINSDEELRSCHTGNRQLPTIDFTSYSLIIGKVYLDISWKLKEQKLEVDGKNVLLHLILEPPTEATSDQMVEYLYWGLYKKINARNIKTKKYYDGKEF